MVGMGHTGHGQDGMGRGPAGTGGQGRVHVVWNPGHGSGSGGRPGPAPAVWPVYAGHLVRVWQPDVVEVVIELAALGVTLLRVVRLAGLHAPDRDSPSGARAVAWLRDWLRAQARAGGAAAPLTAARVPVIVAVSAVDEWGRPLCWIWARDSGRCLNEDMVDAGMAVGWRFGRQAGRGPSAYPPADADADAMEVAHDAG